MEEKSSFPGRLPDEIEAEILLRLPVKSLKRFQCACKSWSSLISSPQFQIDHFRRAQQNPRILTLQSDATVNDDDFDDLTLRFSVYNKDGSPVNNFSKPVPRPYFDSTVVGKPLLHSCQGLVCIASYAGPILVCNPSTEEMISLPSLTGANHCFGIGYTSSTQEFKVVCISYRNDVCCEVFTLGTNCWRKARTPSPFRVNQGTAPFLNGAFHFLSAVGICGVKDTDCIAAFDIETEDYRRIPLPEFYYGLGDCQRRNIVNTSNFLRLTKLGGELCLTFDFGELDERLEVWVLKDYNGEWVKGYDINVSSVYPYPSYCFWAFPSDNTGSESILLSCADEKGVKVLCYNTDDGIVTLMKDKEWGATFYTESFYRLKDGSVSSEISVVGSKTEAMEGRIAVAVGARKYGSVPKNKYDGNSEDGEDGNGEDGDDQDQDCDDHADDDDEKDEEDEEIPHPPTKKLK